MSEKATIKVPGTRRVRRRAAALYIRCLIRGYPGDLHNDRAGAASRRRGLCATQFCAAVLGRDPDPAAIEAVMASHFDCLDAAFDSITRDFGSMENYLASAGGLDDDSDPGCTRCCWSSLPRTPDAEEARFSLLRISTDPVAEAVVERV
jgi:hypothetical protein